MENQIQKQLELKKKLEKIFSEIQDEATKKKIYPYNDKFASPEYLGLVKETNDESEAMLKNYFEQDLKRKGPEHFSRENVFVWGGPTRQWGGSMEKDTSIKAKEFFGLDNVMYVYGPLNKEMLELHQGCKKLICHLGRNCRTEGAAMKSDVEEAEFLSKMSLEYPNIIGGVMDDMIQNLGENYSHKEYRAIHEALHKHNPALELYGVAYSWELEKMPETVKTVSDCIDHVILWFWSKLDLMEFDAALEKCRLLFPGKPVMLGIFMYDYGIARLPNSPETMKYHFENYHAIYFFHVSSYLK